MKKLLGQAWTLIMVTVITLLVWLYAEDANVKTYNNERVLIRFVGPDDSEMIIEPGGATVLASLTGSNGQFQQFRRNREDLQVIEIPVAISPGAGSTVQQVDLRRELEDSELLEDLGLNLTQVDPETLNVAIQRVESVALDVLVNSRGLDLAREAEPSIQQVTVMLPASVAAGVKRDKPPAVIDLTTAPLDDITPGTDSRLTIPIDLPDFGNLPDGFDLRPSATEAVVTFRLVVEQEPFTVERAFVKLTGPAGVGDRYVIRIPEEYQFLSNLQVQGPPDQIATLRENTAARMLATIDLSNAEADTAAAGDGVVTKPVQVFFLNLPGIRLVSEPPRIPVEVRLRESPTDTP